MRLISINFEEVETVNKKHKTALIIIVCIIVVLVVMHFSLNYFVPFIKNMHSGMF